MWYVKPAAARAERMKGIGKRPVWEPETPEEEEAMLAMMMMALPGKVVKREQANGGTDAGESRGCDSEGG